MYWANKHYNIQLYAQKFFFYDGYYHSRSIGVYFYGYEARLWYSPDNRSLVLRLKEPTDVVVVEGRVIAYLNKDFWIKLLKF